MRRAAILIIVAISACGPATHEEPAPSATLVAATAPLPVATSSVLSLRPAPASSSIGPSGVSVPPATSTIASGAPTSAPTVAPTIVPTLSPTAPPTATPLLASEIVVRTLAAVDRVTSVKSKTTFSGMDVGTDAAGAVFVSRSDRSRTEIFQAPDREEILIEDRVTGARTREVRVATTGYIFDLVTKAAAEIYALRQPVTVSSAGILGPGTISWLRSSPIGGRSIPCGTGSCYLLTSVQVTTGTLGATTTFSALIDDSTFLPVQVTYVLAWANGVQPRRDVQDLYDYGVPNPIAP